jgi:hypothetical protein
MRQMQPPQMEAWTMEQVNQGIPLPGLYPMSAETRARYESDKTRRR